MQKSGRDGTAGAGSHESASLEHRMYKYVISRRASGAAEAAQQARDAFYGVKYALFSSLIIVCGVSQKKTKHIY